MATLIKLLTNGRFRNDTIVGVSIPNRYAIGGYVKNLSIGNTARIASAAVLAAGLMFGGTAAALAQQKSGAMQKQLVGTWMLVSAENTHSDGKKSYPFGEKPNGMAIYTANGRFMIVNTTPGTPKFASNSRLSGTAEENKAVVNSSIALFGTYSVNDADKVMSQRIEGSTYPNWVGQDQKRTINSLSNDQLVFTNPAASAGGATTLLTWKRVK
jgi:hypothetical protein